MQPLAKISTSRQSHTSRQLSHTNRPLSRTSQIPRIHNIGHIHNANFAQSQFSTSHPQKQHFLKSREFTFLWKYSVCGLKFEISEYPLKLLYVTYSPYQYELERIKTHEMRAKNFPPFFFPSTVKKKSQRSFIILDLFETKVNS